uniref:Dihydrofolate synthase/folylpolyglutamate synthase n=1 Tax=Candidatus Kentrum sp. FW TaxID=2126338 RepID=A0A450SPX5_9GAMM|nr:MAG: dihydrofolate synthase / folylpolyglutamate synthase [Candidatus Kentron sp. FW]
MRFNHLPDWLTWQETLHHKSVDFGLERIARVAARLGIITMPFPVISVAGTNGKGSCVALLESIFTEAGYRVGVYTSPHFLRYNERVRIMGHEVSDRALVRAFDEIDRARADTTLTYFEFGTLAAAILFCHATPDVVVLEVGVGGRLDAVNLFDADLALVTTVGIDHEAWLGHDREAIGREKAGIYRSGRPAVCGDPYPPVSLQNHAQSIGAVLHRARRDFWFSMETDGWCWNSVGSSYEGLPRPTLIGRHQTQNAAAALMAIELMQDHLPVSEDALRRGIKAATLPGRFQRFLGADGVTRILDVAHNQEAAQMLACTLRDHPCDGRTLAVFAILEDKCIEAVLDAMRTVIDAWYVSNLNVPRGRSTGEIVMAMSRLGMGVHVDVATTVSGAYDAALRSAGPEDRLVIFGSFYTVSEVLESLRSANDCFEIPNRNSA